MNLWSEGLVVKFFIFFPDDTYKIYAHIAEPHSRALGSAVQNGRIVGVEIGSEVNLNDIPFNYKNGFHEHSAQFRSTNMRRYTYWSQLKDDFDTSP